MAHFSAYAIVIRQATQMTIIEDIMCKDYVATIESHAVAGEATYSKIQATQYSNK